MTARRIGGIWSAPVLAAFSGKYSDGGPVFSTEGRRIYFYSNRPRTDESKTNAPVPPDIWFVEKDGNGWSEPHCLGLVARFPGLQFAAQQTITNSGTLYFMAHLSGPHNDAGIYRAEFVGGVYAKPQALPQSINLTPFLNWTPFIAPDESYLLFSSNRRDPDHDDGDLYISRRQPDGSWSDPVSLGEPVNSPTQERFPSVSLGGKCLFFTRWTPDHDEDVFWVNAASIPALHSTANLLKENPK
jgi:Tol biopolymer transport system component